MRRNPLLILGQEARSPWRIGKEEESHAGDEYGDCPFDEEDPGLGIDQPLYVRAQWKFLMSIPIPDIHGS